MEVPNNTKRSLCKIVNISLRDSLLGLTAINQDLVLLECGNVLIQRCYKNSDKVRILAGGVGYSDILHATLVGRGMLTAAVLGEDAAPSPRLIFRTIKELHDAEQNCGIFVLSQVNSALFNFGLATERASSDCRVRLKLLTINDEKGGEIKSGKSCGIVLLSKILGAMAESGVVFEEIYEFYKEIIDEISTVPLNLASEEYLPSKQIRIVSNLDRAIRNILTTKSQSNLQMHPSIPAVALINTCKNLEKLSEFGLIKQVLEKLRDLGVCILRLYLGNFVMDPTLDASLTIINVTNKKIIEYLDAPCNAIGWQQVHQYMPEIAISEISGRLKKSGKEEIGIKGPKLDEKQTNILITSVQFACNALISCERQLNLIDAERSEGNVGTRLKLFSDCVERRILKNKIAMNCPFATLKKLSILADTVMGGTMGAIYGIFFENVASAFENFDENEPVTPEMWAKALTVGAIATQKYSNEELDTNTMLHPIKQSCLALNKEFEGNRYMIEIYGLAVTSAEESAQQTRAPDCKYPDAGAHAVGIWMRAIFEGIKLLTLPGGEINPE